MPVCKKNPKRHYTGKEPSPKGLGYCASSEEEGTIMKGRDGNMWIKSKGKWIKHKEEDEEDDFEEKLDKKLYKWWQKLAEGNIILIYKDGKHELVTSSMKTFKAQVKDITLKWHEFQNDENVEAIIWSAQSSDIIEEFIYYLTKKHSKKELEEMIKMKDLPDYLLKNYKKYFVKYEFYGKKDYTLKM